MPTPVANETRKSVIGAIRTPLWFGVLAMLIGNGLLSTLISVRAGTEGFQTITVGIIASAYYVGYLAGSRVGQNFIHRVGHIRTFAALAAIASATASLHAIFISPMIWIVLRAVTGLCFAGLYIVLESWINSKTTNQNRGHILSIYMIVSLGGLALGQQFLNLFSPTGFELFILSSLTISLSLVPFVLTDLTAPKIPVSGRLNIRSILQISPLGIVGCFAAGMGNSAFWGLAPVFADAIGFNVAHIAMFMSSVILGGIVGQWPIGRLSDLYDRRRVIALVCLLNAIMSSAIFLSVNQSEVLLVFFGLLFGSFAMTLYSLCVAHTNDLMEKADMVEAGSALLGSFAGGAIFGPFIASLAMQTFGPEGLFLYTAIVSICLGVFAIQRVLTHTSVPQIEKDKFFAVPETSAIAHHLHPSVSNTESKDCDLRKLVH